MLGGTADDTVRIGDDSRGYFPCAERVGMRPVLMRTGKFGEQDLSLGIAPDAVLDLLEQLPVWCREAGIAG
jgi:phospholysine phosphohistidine inorganic pyrophosphate phosphatase